MSLVNLVSGGLDSTLVGVMAREEGLHVYPLFVDYGQRAGRQEWEACQQVHKRHGLSMPARVDVSGFGRVVRSGLTSSELDVRNDAFTPGRNLLFLLVGSSFAYQVGATAVSIGLLSEQFSLFPDQRPNFVRKAEEAIEAALARRISVLTPLADFSKADVIELAQSKGITGTYSCHLGGSQACGRCIACLEFNLGTGEGNGR